MTNKNRNAALNLWKKMRRRWQLYLLLLLPIAYIIAFQYLPMGAVIIAFKKYNAKDGILGSPWVGLANFRRFLGSLNFRSILINTLTLSVYQLLLFPLPIIFALLLNAMRNRRYAKVIQTVTYFPHFISTVVIVGLVFQLMNNRTGIYGSIYRAITGVVGPNLLASGPLFRHIYVWSGQWQNLGFNAIIYIAALAGVDVTLHEAAMIDGASRLQRIWHVDLPGILPTVTIMLIMATGQLMSIGYEKVLLMQNGLNLDYSEIISTYVYKTGLASTRANFSLASAVDLFNSVINFILLMTVNKITKSLDGTSLF